MGFSDRVSGIALQDVGHAFVADAGHSGGPAIIQVTLSAGAQSIVSQNGIFVAPDGIAVVPACGKVRPVHGTPLLWKVHAAVQHDAAVPLAAPSSHCSPAR